MASPVDGALEGRDAADGFLGRLLENRGRYELVVPDDTRRDLARGWLGLAVLSLVASGIFSILLVASRMPGLEGFFPGEDFFRIALVVHVDLSVLVWFVAFAGILWSLNSMPRWLALGWAAFAAAVAGTILMSIAPFAARGEAVMANYIPVLVNPVFLAGLLVLAAGVALLTLRGMFAVPRVGVRLDGGGALRFGMNGSVVATAVALIAFAWSFFAVPHELDGKAYYELLFWGGGHVLQFTWTLLMMAVWLWLLSAAGVPVVLTPRVVLFLFGVGLASVFLTPVIYLAYPVPSVEHYRILTWLMRFGGGLAILPLALAVALGLVRAPSVSAQSRPLVAALGASLVLFSAGGVIGFLIQGSNVKIPAHYHGCIVGITLAFMGITFHLLPRLGLGEAPLRLAFWQPIVYGAGQLLHVAGLVWSGGYGVQRKVAGAEQLLVTLERKIAMSLMGVGGFIAIVGGVMFIVAVMVALRGARRNN